MWCTLHTTLEYQWWYDTLLPTTSSTRAKAHSAKTLCLPSRFFIKSNEQFSLSATHEYPPRCLRNRGIPSTTHAHLAVLTRENVLVTLCVLCCPGIGQRIPSEGGGVRGSSPSSRLSYRAEMVLGKSRVSPTSSIEGNRSLHQVWVRHTQCVCTRCTGRLCDWRSWCVSAAVTTAIWRF